MRAVPGSRRLLRGADLLQLSIRDLSIVTFGHGMQTERRWLVPLGLYMDETGQDSGAILCVVAGFLGLDQQWENFIAKWKEARKPSPCLHLSGMNWKHRGAVKQLLAKLAPIPYECGLTPVMASVYWKDWKDAVKGQVTASQELLMSPYMGCVQSCIASTLKHIQPSEPVSFFAEQQDRYRDYAEVLQRAIAWHSRNRAGAVYGPSYLPPCSTPALEVADYLTYGLRQHFLAPDDFRAQYTRPILRGDILATLLTGDVLKNLVAQLKAMDKEDGTKN